MRLNDIKKLIEKNDMNKLFRNRIFAIISLSVLVYCLSILIEKRISSDNGFEFKIWSPVHLLLAIIVPFAILFPLKIFSTSQYSKFILLREKKLKMITTILTGFLLLWLLGWYGMIGVGNLIDRSFNQSEADEAAITYIRNDSIVQDNIGKVDSIEQISYSIESSAAKYTYILYGKDSIMNIEVWLDHGQNWTVDTLIIK